MVRMPDRRNRGRARRVCDDWPRLRSAHGQTAALAWRPLRARRGGVARALMAAVARRALDLDCEAVYWELWRPNTLGRTFYERLGAEQADELEVMRLGRLSLSMIDRKT